MFIISHIGAVYVWPISSGGTEMAGLHLPGRVSKDSPGRALQYSLCKDIISISSGPSKVPATLYLNNKYLFNLQMTQYGVL